MARKKKEPTNKLRGKDGPDDHAISTAITACVMGVPVDPDDGFPQDQVAGLREEIQAMMARGVMVDIPDSMDDFDPDEFREDDPPTTVPENTPATPPVSVGSSHSEPPQGARMADEKVWCPLCPGEVDPKALRCALCGTPFRGPAKRTPTTIAPVRYCDKGPIRDEKGRLYFPGVSMTFGRDLPEPRLARLEDH